MGGNRSHDLALLSEAERSLGEATNLNEIRLIRDKAEAVRKYAQSASLGLDVQNRAAEVKLRAERQAGKLLSQLTLRGGDRRSKSHGERLKLGDLGLSANQSKRWQLQARVPENIFLAHVKQTRETGKELTSAGLMRLAKQLRPRRTHDRTSADRQASCRFSAHNAAPGKRRRWIDSKPTTTVGGLLSDLKDHHTVLDGILHQLYGSSQTLRPAELRMIRYLMAESGTLIATLESLAEEAIAGAYREAPIRA
jgi:hypothetical protein